MQFKKLIIIQIFCLLLITGNLKAVTFTGGYIETEFLSHFGPGATNSNPAGTWLYQQLYFGFEGQATKSLEIKTALQTTWASIAPVNQLRTATLNTILNNVIIQAIYKPLPYLTLQLGDVRVNYSPYTIHTEEWEEDMFKGLMLEIKQDNFYLHSFIGFHAQATNDLMFQGQNFKSDLGYNYAFYNQEDVLVEWAAIWGGLMANYQFTKEDNIKFIYVHENYRLDNPGYGYYFFFNNIFQAELNYNPVDFLKLSGLYALYGRDYDAYAGQWNFFGQGKHLITLDYSQNNFYPAYEFGGIVTNPLVKNNYLWGTQLGIYYRYVDAQYNPVHMFNGRWDEDRGEDFLNYIFNDVKGPIIKFIQPLYPTLDFGIEYRDFENNIGTTDHQDARIYFKFKSIFKRINLLLLYRLQKLENATFSEGGNQLDGLYVNLDFDILSKLKSTIIYTENRNDIQGFNEFLWQLQYNF